MHGADEIGHGGVAAELVGRPAAGDHEAVDLVGPDVRSQPLRPSLEAALAADRVQRDAHGRHPGAGLAQSHDGDPVLQIFDAVAHEDDRAHPLEWGVRAHRAPILLAYEATGSASNGGASTMRARVCAKVVTAA